MYVIKCKKYILEIIYIVLKCSSILFSLNKSNKFSNSYSTTTIFFFFHLFFTTSVLLQDWRAKAGNQNVAKISCIAKGIPSHLTKVNEKQK